MQRRQFLRSSSLVLAAASIPAFSRSQTTKSKELRISSIVVQSAKGRRPTPVAPNAYAEYRGYDNAETILRIKTSQGLEGFAAWRPKPETLKELIGLDPFALFTWSGDVVTGVAEEHGDLLKRLGGADVALFDLMAKAMGKPVHQLLGSGVRQSVPIYDSSLYMEDLLKGDQLKDLPYISGAIPKDPVELVVKKAEWIMKNRPEGFKALKIKIGRVKWMGSFDDSVARDIAVTNALRKTLGPDIRLMVDGNKAYAKKPLATLEYAAAVKESGIYFMEEMFPETDIANTVELKKGLLRAGDPVKLAAGESFGGGIPEKIYKMRSGDAPLIDVEQADMNAHGFIRLREKAAEQAKLGMTLAPHNFGSRIGLCAQAHLGLVVPNWEIAEMDDSNFPGISNPGIVLKNGEATVSGAPGLGVVLNESHLEKPSLELTA